MWLKKLTSSQLLLQSDYFSGDGHSRFLEFNISKREWIESQMRNIKSKLCQTVNISGLYWVTLAEKTKKSFRTCQERGQKLTWTWVMKFSTTNYVWFKNNYFRSIISRGIPLWDFKALNFHLGLEGFSKFPLRIEWVFFQW